jgi:hypothetical protein
VAEEGSPRGAAPCRHHWLIEPAGSKKSKGVCKLCGAVREFLNDSNPSFVVDKRTEATRVYF